MEVENFDEKFRDLKNFKSQIEIIIRSITEKTEELKDIYKKYIDNMNFLNDDKIKNKDFMLLCGFEKFNNFYVRIDILERLFVQIINSDTKNMKEIKMIPEMLNLLGCNKDDFKQLLKAMSYKILEKNNEVFFKYIPKKKVKSQNKGNIKENPFGVLKNLNLN